MSGRLALVRGYDPGPQPLGALALWSCLEDPVTESKLPAWPAYAAAAWAFVFGAIHAAWALGWRAGLTPQ